MIVAASLFAGLGAVCRFLIDSWVNRHNRLTIPLGTIVVNVSACFLMGLLTGWALVTTGSGQAKLLLGSGFLGGYSTFSTASYEGMVLLRKGQIIPGIAQISVMLLSGMAAALIGFSFFS